MSGDHARRAVPAIFVLEGTEDGANNKSDVDIIVIDAAYAGRLEYRIGDAGEGRKLFSKYARDVGALRRFFFRYRDEAEDDGKEVFDAMSHLLCEQLLALDSLLQFSFQQCLDGHIPRYTQDDLNLSGIVGDGSEEI